MLEFIRNITSRRNEDGASAVEYGLLVAGIAALIVAIVFVFGGVIKNAFNSTCKTVKGNGYRREHLLLTVRLDPERPDQVSPGSRAPAALSTWRAAELTHLRYHGVQVWRWLLSGHA